MTSPTATAKAAADAECPDGNDVEVGMATQRSWGTPCSCRAGRSRRPRRFIGWLLTSEAAPIAATPVAAARRPRGPPTTASRPATRNHGLEWLAKVVSARSGRSRTGVESRATATYAWRSYVPSAWSSRPADGRRAEALRQPFLGRLDGERRRS